MARRFNCLTKVGEINGVLQGYNGMITFHSVTNLLKFTEFLDRDYPNWKFYNVYDKKTKGKLGSFTKHRKPSAAFI